MFKFWRKKIEPAVPPRGRQSLFSTHALDHKRPELDFGLMLENMRKAQPILSAEYAMDDSDSGFPDFKMYNGGGANIPDAVILWYSAQSFIGHQLSGMIAQHWLVNKICSMPGDDAIRGGFNIVSVDGDDLPAPALKMLRRYDRAYRINGHLREFIRKGRIFGVRIAMFKVESTDPEYYLKPFNIDGISPKSYKGIVQVDPYWTAPMLDQASASQPDSLHFYEPTFWIINGQQVHRSHLVIYRHANPIDLLKPLYLYGGIPLPQMIMERVYAAERTANEAPQLAMTKRTTVLMTDLEKAFADVNKTRINLENWAAFRDNYAIKLGSKEDEEFQQFDTSLADLDAVIMSQYQLCCSIGNVPATKVLGTTPKGFNSTGDYEEASYHEELESIRAHDLTPLLDRHHELVMKAFVEPAIAEARGKQLSVNWEPLDSPTALELANENLVKAQTGAALIASGAISSEEERRRVATDKQSGYNEMGLADEETPGLEDDDEVEAEAEDE